MTDDLKSRSQIRRAAVQNPDALVAEIERLREALDEIALHGISRPLGEGEGDDGDGHWRRIALSCIRIAARARFKKAGGSA